MNMQTEQKAPCTKVVLHIKLILQLITARGFMGSLSSMFYFMNNLLYLILCWIYVNVYCETTKCKSDLYNNN